MEEVYDFIRTRIGLNSNDTVVIGVSGGPDSMVLLHIMNEFKEALGLKIVCAHVNHNVRKESEQERIDLERYCKNNNIIFECIKIENWSRDNFHNEARMVRYNFFEEIIENYGAKFLMTAHHGDDLIETILMRIVRGSTLKGYSGFSRIVNKDGYKIVRPLLTITKDSIMDFVRDNNISYAIDSSNNEDHYTRNRYRHVVLPFLKNEESNVHKKFLKFSETLLENSSYIDNEANKAIYKVFQNGILDINKLNMQEHVIQTKIIYNILEKIYGDDLLIIGDVHVDLIFNLINSIKSNSCVYLPNGVIVTKSYNEITFDYSDEEYEEYSFIIDEIVNLPNGKIIEKVDSSNDSSNFTIRLNSNDIKLPLYVRNRKNGDKIKIKGMNGTKKISDVFINEKIKKHIRNTWPVVIDSNENVVWIPGLKKSYLDKKNTEEYDIILKYY